MPISDQRELHLQFLKIPENYSIYQKLLQQKEEKRNRYRFGIVTLLEFVEKYIVKIWIEGEVGKGSDFKFTLPIYDELANSINN
jgi:light-regulated signal transduction histidine kinase (bacteriophytochrome)